MNVEITRTDSELRERVWHFWFDDSKCRLVLIRYMLIERPSTRHKMRVTAAYNRLDIRGSKLKIDDVPWDTTIEQEAMSELVKRITVVKQ